MAAASDRVEAVCLGNTPDGMLGTSEACDDNNTTDGDGCSKTCDIEAEYSCSRPVSFSELDIENFPGSTAMWNVAPDGLSGIQVVNTPAPSVTLFGEDATMGTFAMRVEVQEIADDDFIGLALGFHQNDQTNPNASYLVIDWKQGLQDAVPPGLRLAHVRGVPPGFGQHSQHPIAQRICPIATSCAKQLAIGKTLGATGWKDNTPYTFQLTYRADRLQLRVDGALEFDVKPTDFPGQFLNDAFPTGPLGFYLLSQEQVRVTNLAPRAPSFCNVTDLEPATISVGPGTPSVVIDTASLMRDTDDMLDPRSVSVVSVTGGAATVNVRPDGSIEVIPADPNLPATYVVTIYACDDDEQLADCDTTTVTIRYGDTDGDGHLDSNDDCPDAADPDQVDADGDGIGDVCDPDANGDGFDDGLGISGGGCATTGGTGALVALAAAALLFRRRRRGAAIARSVGPALGLAVILIGADAASAQISTQYSAERFELTGHRDGILGVEWADVRGHLALDGGVWLGYANDPVNLYDMPTGDRVGSLVHNRFGGDIVVALPLWRRLEIGLGAPLIFSQSADLGSAMPGTDLSGAGLGDLRLGLKATALRRGKTALAVMINVGLPTSTLDDYGGDDGVSLSPALALSYGARRGIRFAINAGYRVRPSATALNLQVDDELYGRAGLGYRFPSSLELDATFDIATGADDVLGSFNRNHAEARAGAAYDITRALRLFGAAGLGLAEGFGTPDWRALLGVRLGRSDEPRERPLPPPDTDRDGILDIVDRCPAVAETVNSFEDDDGCPDDPDPDKDGLLAGADQCPNDPEDMDGFEDANGCPDPDNDADGVLDTADKCRDVPGIIAMQGCPDPDRDGDTVPDRIDNCPDEPGKVELQGCNKEQRVVIKDNKLEILDIVYFATDRAVIQPKSYKILDEVARVLNAHPEIAKILVEGHTDDQGNDAYNKDLSQRRAEAVRMYLIQRNVDRNRLDAKGFGEEQPKTDNTTPQGRATNRRVEFTLETPTPGVQVQPTGP